MLIQISYLIIHIVIGKDRLRLIERIGVFFIGTTKHSPRKFTLYTRLRTFLINLIITLCRIQIRRTLKSLMISTFLSFSWNTNYRVEVIRVQNLLVLKYQLDNIFSRDHHIDLFIHELHEKCITCLAIMTILRLYILNHESVSYLARWKHPILKIGTVFLVKFKHIILIALLINLQIDTFNIGLLQIHGFLKLFGIKTKLNL